MLFLSSSYSEELGAGARSVLLRSLQEHYRSQEKEAQEEVWPDLSGWLKDRI